METFIILVFVLGYLAIVLEHPLKINKSASALLTGVLVWAIWIMMQTGDKELVTEALDHHLGSTAGILFFLRIFKIETVKPNRLKIYLDL